MKNRWIRFGREPFSRMKHQKIYRLSLLPSHFYSSGQSYSSGLVTNLAEHFGGNLKNHENHDFQAAPAPNARFSSQGRRAAAQCLKCLVEPCSDRVIRGWGGASWHFQKDLGFYDIGGSFLEILEIPEFILDGSIFPGWSIKRSIVWSYSRLISIRLENFPFRVGDQPGWAFWWKSEKSWKSWLSSRPGSQNTLFEPGALHCRAMFKVTRRALLR